MNSNAYTEEAYASGNETPGWKKMLYGVDAVIIIILAALEVLLIRSYKKKKQAAK